MDLNDVNVLIDGYNLEFKQGTGIKTYGLTLLSALKFLKANVNMLSSKGTNNTDPLLNEILFFDSYEENSKNKVNLSYIKSAIKIACGINTAKPISLLTFSKKVIQNDIQYPFKDFDRIFSLKECYKVAYGLFDITNMTTKVRIPQRIDVWHATYPLPIEVKRSKKITTVHDLVPLKLPRLTLDDKTYYYKCMKKSLKNSDLIICVSENTKRDIMDFFDTNPNKIFVTYQPLVLKPRSINENSSFNLKKYGIKERNYILFVGAIEPKKNIKRLIEAYSLLDTEMPLVIVGKKGWLWEEEINLATANKNIILLNYVPMDDLSSLYSSALFFIFPSIYEGFGLPLLEAMSFGCPVITSNVSSLPEVAGDAALYVDPYDTSDIRLKMESLLNNAQLREKLSELGRKRVEKFSMENYMKKVYEAYASVL